MDGTDILARLRERVGDRVLATHEYRGDHTAMVSREGLLPALTLCRDDAALAFDLLVDVTAVDSVPDAVRDYIERNRLYAGADS